MGRRSSKACLSLLVHPLRLKAVHTDVAMLLQRRRIYASSPGNFYRLQSESTGKQLCGFSHGSDFAKLGDKDGSKWSGTVSSDDNGGYTYRFRDAAGETMSGTSEGGSILLRDSQGRIWKGFVD